ncbi:amidase [Paenibacillus sp. NFR01]|uniref:amidase n=1 Tax=Paenibacillus sp. NFR01 TaxID=1566279 RepID=UPI000B833D53|nr:amidase [Paenibacillus sp. NFR01]
MDNEYGAWIAPELNVRGSGCGPLQGLRFGVKDVFAVAGHRTSAGNPDWLRTHEPAGEHAEAVARLLRAGADLRGAAHTDELMYSLGGENDHYGTPRNPHAADRLPGGSSSGSAVAVAAGSCDFALGTDTGGSVRVPAAYCGVFGFRPTHGAVGMGGVIPLAPGFDTAGWLARSPEMLLRVGEVLLPAALSDAAVGGVGKDGDGSGGRGIRRLILPPEAWALADEVARRPLLHALRRIEPRVEETLELEIAPEGLAAWMTLFRELQAAEIWATHGAWIARERPAFGPDIAARFAWAEQIAGADHGRARAQRGDIALQLRQLLGDDGALVIPTVPGAAPLRGGDAAQRERSRSGAMMLTCIAGLAGLPQVTLPVSGPGGLPLGLSVVGGHGQDLRLLAWVQQVWGW